MSLKLSASTSNFRGQTFIGVIIAMGVFTILSQAVITLVFSAYDLIIYTRARTSAQHIANEKMETIRNLPFDSVGTVGGIPSGILPQEENTARNGQNYIVKTAVIYFDDPFDGLAPNDTLPNDYKRVRIDVSWGGIAPSRGNTITLISDVAPEGTESATGGGTLSILIFNANGEPVPQASVSIVAPSVSPPVNLSLETDSFGRIILPGAPACSSCYQITVTKDGMSTERTYSVSEIANPAKPNPTIIEGQLTEVSFAIDQLSNLTIETYSDRESGFTPLANQALHIRGEKILGTTEYDEPVYKIDQDITTLSDGTLALENFEWDNYYLTLPTGSGLIFSGTNPMIPIMLLPSTTLTSKLAISSNTTYSLLATFADTTGSLVASVSASLSDGASFTASASSGLADDPDFGQVYFPGLEAKSYTLEASASGYAAHNQNINITGNNKETITLNPE